MKRCSLGTTRKRESIYVDDDDIIRIISARKAEQGERKRYVNGN